MHNQSSCYNWDQWGLGGGSVFGLQSAAGLELWLHTETPLTDENRPMGINCTMKLALNK